MKARLLINPLKQELTFSCWACCTRMLLTYYKAEIFGTDKQLINAAGMDDAKYEDVGKSLEHFKVYNGQDDTKNIPTLEEILEQINKTRALIACVTEKQYSFKQNPKKGHYVVICGADDRGKLIQVIDPADGKARWIPYSETVYPMSSGGTMFWASTYYTKRPEDTE